MMAFVLLVVAQVPTPAAHVDFRGHAPATLQSLLESQLPSLEACRAPPPPTAAVHGRRPPAVRAGPYDTTVEFVVVPSGMVSTVKVTSPGALEADCVHQRLLRLEFGPRPNPVSARETFVIATLRCGATSCRWTWMPPEAD